MRKLTAEDLQRLEDFLLSLDEDAMLLSKLDGFLAGIVVCPDLILPGEWMPVIWGAEGPLFEDEHEANEILGLIMARYNQIIHSLGRPGKYEPILVQDTDDSYLWEFWASGFGKAIDLRPDGWAAFDDAQDQDVVSAFGSLASLAILAEEERRLPEEDDREIRQHAADFIADCLEQLHAARLALHQSKAAPPQYARPVGRNDPCPCGSGKKFKKCCLN